MPDDPATCGAIDETPIPRLGNMEWISLFLLIATGLVLLFWVLLRCGSGFDFTDESFDLNWISDPFRYHSSVSQFGFFYHPFYKWLGGSVAALRQFNVVVSFLMSLALTISILVSIGRGRPKLDMSSRAGLYGAAAALAFSSLIFFERWLPTPSYNSLAFQSLLLVMIGISLLDGKPAKGALMAWALVVVGGGLVFLAKPTTASVLAPAVVAYLALTGRLSPGRLLLLAAGSVGFLVIAALAIDGSPVKFFNRLVDGAHLNDQLMSGQQFSYVASRIFNSTGIRNGTWPIVGLVLVPLFLVITGNAERNYPVRLILDMTVIAVTLTCLVVVSGLLSPVIEPSPFQPFQFLAILITVVLVACFSPGPSVRRASRNNVILAGLLSILPCVYAFGTNAEFWTTAGHAGFFWILAATVLAIEFGEQDPWRMLLPIASMSLLICMAVLYAGMQAPYRQLQGLSQQTTAVAINREGSKLLLGPEAAHYVSELSRKAEENGFVVGDFMLDFTGTSPGSLYVIGARPLGSAWTLGGYPGSNDFLVTALGWETCEAIGMSWILIEPGSSNAYSPDLLRQFGINLANDYREVASIKSIRTISPNIFEHRLLKPARDRDTAAAACRNARHKTGS